MSEHRSDHYRTGPGKCACGFDAYKANGIMLDYGEILFGHIDRARKKERRVLQAERERRQATEALRAEDV